RTALGGLPLRDGRRNTMSEEVLVFSVHNLVKVFGHGRRRSLRPALDDISFDVHRGEALGIVGESGSGKTTVGRILVGLETATSGVVTHEGVEVSAMNRGARKRFRRRVQMVFQNPFASLNPFRTVRSMLSDGFLRGVSRA